MKKLLVLSASLIAACTQLHSNQSYAPPIALSQSATQVFGHPQREIFMAATRALIANGYEITQSDTTEGIISTEPHKIHLSPNQADCGLLNGINPLLDNKTATDLEINVLVGFHKLEVKATIEGVYKPNSQAELTLSCVSKGLLEQDMIQKIRAEIR